MKQGKIEREKRVVELMVHLYCRHKLGLKQTPEEYLQLIAYAHKRLDNCKFGEQKSACKRCPIHCYAPQRREQIREVMRWVGPRMMWYSPIEALRHIFG